MRDHVHRFQLIVAGCATLTLLVAAWLTRVPAQQVDRSTLVAFLTMFGIATAVVATAGRMPARLTGWLCGIGGVGAFVGYLLGQPWALWVYAAAAVLALATVGALALGGRRPN